MSEKLTVNRTNFLLTRAANVTGNPELDRGGRSISRVLTQM
jgi:hypothetical protein